MAELSEFDVQTKIVPVLKSIVAVDPKTAVRTAKLAKRLRVFIKHDAGSIAMHLEHIAQTPWGRKHATFVGGTSDPLNQHIWALPAEE